MNSNVLCAVFRRNFVSYFASPTGYVFICVFVLLSSFAAFWPNEFFNANLANLDQLSKVFPFIMLVFIPAITMSIWADERRQGTDELLLTIPAGDFDIVLGKYLAAVAIYSVALVFSLVCNFVVLQTLGSPDTGLFLGTYAGYWMVGLAMLAIGMVASFLTGNLTIAFVWGVIFNIPLVFAVKADVIFPAGPARAIKNCSMGQKLADFDRGVISLSGVAYFLLIVVVMLYLSMVLIGRRHWLTGKQRAEMSAHYLVRTLALVLIAVGLVAIFGRHDSRLDVSSEGLSSLSPDTRKLLKNLKLERPVQIEAFVSPTVPEAYVQTKLNLLSMLRELKASGGGKVHVQINRPQRFSEEAARAEQRYGIQPRQVTTTKRGAMSQDYIFLGVAMSSGMEKVIVPFIDRGIPIEYELVRSIATVAKQERKRVGVVGTDARLYGQFNMMTMSGGENWPIIEELEKQYDVEQVDLTNPIAEKYDVLLAVQPSSLGPEQMDNFIAAIESGQKTAIFEDPMPVFNFNVPATSAPRRMPGGMNPWMMRQQGPPPKGDISKLWRLLGIDFTTDQIIWQDYNPYPKATHFPKEFVFVDEAAGAKEPFNNDHAISSKLQHMLFPFPGAVSKLHASEFEVTPLVRTGSKTGIVRYEDLVQMTPFGPRGINPNPRKRPTNKEYFLAVHVRGKVKPAVPPDQGDKPDEKSDDKSDKESKNAAPKEAAIDVVLVADIDMLSRDFFELRKRGEIPEAGIHFDFDNVTFVLNVLDALAADEQFIEIRKRRPRHRTLTGIEEKTETAKREAAQAREECNKECEEGEQREQKAFDKKIQDLQKRKNIDPQQMLIEVALAQEDGRRRLEAEKEKLKRKRDQRVNKIETDLALQVRAVQDWYKFWAVVLPPIPPLLVGIAVFFTRRAREREGVARERLR